MSPTDEDIRVALIGFGMAGAVFHAPLIAATEGLSLTTIVTADEGRAADAASRFPSARVVPSAEDVWSDAGGHDLAVVAGPNRAHASLALAAIEAGLGVVVDKPLAVTAEEGRRLRDAAADRAVLISAFHNRRWDGDFLTLRRLVAERALGDVHRLESRFERWRPEPREGAWRESDDPADAGGLLYDLGSHLIDQALVLFGPVRSVYAELDVVRPGARVDDDVFVALAHEGGARSHLWASAVAAEGGPRLRALGSAGAYVKHGMDVQEDALKDGQAPGGPDWGAEPEGAWGAAGSPGGMRAVPTQPGDYPAYYAGIRDALRHRSPPPVTVDEAIAVLELIEAARRSGERGEVVRL